MYDTTKVEKKCLEEDEKYSGKWIHGCTFVYT